VIVNGRVKIGRYLDEGKEITTAILSTGEIFGELVLAGEETRRDFAQAMDDCTICPLSLNEMKELMYENRELSFRMLKFVGLRLMKLERKLELLVFKVARTQIVEFIKRRCFLEGEKSGL